MTSAGSFFYLLPAFPDGELVNPFLRRVNEAHGDRAFNAICRQLLSRKTGLDCMPSNLSQFHSSIGYLYADLESLLERRTLFHYYCRGLPPQRVEEQRRRVLEKIPGPVRLVRLPVLFTPSEGEYLTCPDCRAVAIETYGFEYVHRCSVAPFVSVCPIHERPLETSAKQGLLFDQACRSTPSQYQLSRAVEFARRTSQCIENDLFGHQYTKAGVRQALTQARWIGANGRLRLTELIDTFQLFYAGAFADERLSLLLESSDHVRTAIRALLRNNAAVHPVWCICFAWFSQECSYWAVDSRATLKPAVKTIVPTDDEIRRLLAEHGSLRTVAKLVNVDRSRLAIRCRLAKIDFPHTSRVIDDNQLEWVVRELKNGARPDAIARASRLSSRTVYRILASLQNVEMPRARRAQAQTVRAKRRWSQLRRLHPQAGVYELLKRAPSVHAQLRRHDIRWLTLNSPKAVAKVKTCKPKRAPSLVKKLERTMTLAAKEHDDSQQQRLSTFRLRAVLGISEYALASSTGALTQRLCRNGIEG